MRLCMANGLLVQLDACTISGSNLLLRFSTPETGVSGSTTYRIKRESMIVNEVDLDVISPDTVPVEYTPDPIDEYLVIVNMPEDWEIVHNFIIEENEIDGIPNRQIPCTNLKEYSLRGFLSTR